METGTGRAKEEFWKPQRVLDRSGGLGCPGRGGAAAGRGALWWGQAEIRVPQRQVGGSGRWSKGCSGPGNEGEGGVREEK